ncbi:MULTISPECIES: deoxyuridine 5'-triphosphate nucleotidohydrolase [Methanosarcina]|uniref:Probable deoxyuridine 5'-triphosphate nucleotidohydrolase n=3 Tax=Methanosarcina barkeri TaxID=2208 RepID=A0A0E3QS86_METBA|nr:MULTISPECIES: deoxyuridine 5'-triphosphate nucleotidohydrolase [Methanosarcina]AKB53292.1 Deoxyuridine 5'-triphosphate nucleotidohydrolase [Methanosarcina barkeri MS]AKB58602.1 Deoxyuridine 5'-triphosphate nucleotidohydrolase [Methanosarcina barkeri 227]AKJ39403.1 deoxycytidine triphosphate deaminase Dcd [Methanosarcina barkeri CM1]OEC91771.1 deoxyuridine 5'-triphosphate nucleotidohydrolase [Methanosarcina sp. A14]
MTLLSSTELRKLIQAKPPLLENAIDIETQIQPNGLELTLKEVKTIEGSGAVDFDNSERKLPDGKKLEFGDDGWIHLPEGIYKVLFNEIVNIPMNLAAIAKPRSTLIRCGATLETAVWDAGYRGRSESMLVVYNTAGFRLKKDARIMQLLFYTLEAEVEKGYSGIYQNENTK